jgi:putative DNA primase/helicase
MWDHSRFFAMTGRHLPGTPATIEARQTELTTLWLGLFGPKEEKSARTPQSDTTPALEDARILALTTQAKDREKFTRLWEGNTDGYASQSEADLALCCKLAFWTPNAAQIDRLFRQSKLMRDKWDEKRGKQTYGERTIAAALTFQTEHYTPDDGAKLIIGRAAAEAHQRRNGATIPDGVDTVDEDGALPYSDYTNALAFVRDHGPRLRYCYPWKSWLIWTGTHWQRDTSGTVMLWAKDTVKRLARRVEALDDEKKIAALMAHIKSSLSTAKLKAMVESAQSEPGIPVQPEELDADPWLLNCVNGTLDLRGGELKPHRQADLITRCLPISYDTEAQYPTWETFLWRIMGGSQDPDDPDMPTGGLENRQAADLRAKALIGFLQRAIGYTLTGSTREQCIFILHGPTKTGKSTFLATLRALLGAYGQQADMSSFMHKEKEEVRNDLADLAGSRFVCALESKEGRRLAESLVKQLTGGVDLIKARFLFQEHFTFKPQFKIFLGTNHKPVIKDTDNAIWERIRLVPFIVHIPKPERNKALDEQLQAELPGLLAWAVRGCLEWQRLGELGEPDAVVEATAIYRTEMDTIARFLDECCTTGDPKFVKVKASALASAYQAWCKRTGEWPLANRAFILDMEKRGYERKRGTANQYYWHGFGLVDTSDERHDSQPKGVTV